MSWIKYSGKRFESPFESIAYYINYTIIYLFQANLVFLFAISWAISSGLAWNIAGMWSSWQAQRPTVSSVG